ncbi:MAG TPA: hypothetical protein VNG31_08945 [Candidatus Baltobacteraceae bacterium]|nr:hypothetical protein [Candidatus Baltobacteraceae bacterium]
MKVSSISLPAATLAAALLAGCGGGGTVPASSANFGPMAAPHAQACKVKGFWYLQGSCVRTNLTSSGGTYTLPAYRSVTFSLKLGSNTSAGKDPFAFSDATGKGDISGTSGGKAFKPYAKSACFTGFTCPGTVVIYFSNINKGKEVGLLGSSSVRVTDAAGLPGKKLCFPAIPTLKGWIADTKIGVKPSKTAFTIHYPADKLFLPTGQLVVAYACM